MCGRRFTARPCGRACARKMYYRMLQKNLPQKGAIGFRTIPAGARRLETRPQTWRSGGCLKTDGICGPMHAKAEKDEKKTGGFHENAATDKCIRMFTTAPYPPLRCRCNLKISLHSLLHCSCFCYLYSQAYENSGKQPATDKCIQMFITAPDPPLRCQCTLKITLHGFLQLFLPRMLASIWKYGKQPNRIIPMIPCHGGGPFFADISPIHRGGPVWNMRQFCSEAAPNTFAKAKRTPASKLASVIKETKHPKKASANTYDVLLREASAYKLPSTTVPSLRH